MGDEQSEANGDPFDLNGIRELLRLVRENDIAELDLRSDHRRLRIRRGDLAPATFNRPAPMMVEYSPPAPITASTPVVPVAAPTAPGHLITSPIVGTFYSSSSPDTDPFVRVGARVNKETVVCLIEAMKVFNEIQAGVDGVVAEVLVENAQSVEFGQPLFRVQTG